MKIPRCLRLTIIAGLGLVACGGGETVPATPTTAGPPSTATAEATAEPEAAPKPARINVDLMEAKPSRQPDRLPSVRIDGPGREQSVAKHYATNYKLIYRVTNWKSQPEGSYLQFILDNVPAKPITDPKQKVMLSELTEAGKPIAEGEHILALYVARKNHELIKGPNSVAVRRFWVGKKTDSTWNWSKDAIMVQGPPVGTFDGDGALEILSDFFVLNAELGNKKYSVRLTLNGPGIKDEGLMRYLTEWRPVVIWSPGDGEHTLKAELLTPEGATAPVPWNPTVRKFTVTGRAGK
jgi:hypothetical protein